MPYVHELNMRLERLDDAEAADSVCVVQPTYRPAAEDYRGLVLGLPKVLR